MPLHLLVKWEVVSPNSRSRDSGNLYAIYPLFSYSDLLSLGGGGGGCFSFMQFPTFLEKKNSGNKKIIIIFLGIFFFI